jgi:hypothetical protein
MNIHVKRRVHNQSILQLGFRTQAARNFPDMELHTHPSRNLHSTIVSEKYHHYTPINMLDMANIIRQEPEHTSESLVANVKAVQVFGRSLKDNRLSVGLALENNEHLNADRQYYVRALGHHAQGEYRHHVTLIGVDNPTDEAVDRLLAWTAERAPTTVRLGRISVGLSSLLDSDTEVTLSASEKRIA